MKANHDKAYLDEIALLLRQVDLLERLNKLQMSLNSVLPSNGFELGIKSEYAYANKVYSEYEFNSNTLCDPNAVAINASNDHSTNLGKAKAMFIDKQREKLTREVLLTLGFQPKTVNPS